MPPVKPNITVNVSLPSSHHSRGNLTRQQGVNGTLVLGSLLSNLTLPYQPDKNLTSRKARSTSELIPPVVVNKTLSTQHHYPRANLTHAQRTQSATDSQVSFGQNKSTIATKPPSKGSVQKQRVNNQTTTTPSTNLRNNVTIKHKQKGNDTSQSLMKAWGDGDFGASRHKQTPQSNLSIIYDRKNADSPSSTQFSVAASAAHNETVSQQTSLLKARLPPPSSRQIKWYRNGSLSLNPETFNASRTWLNTHIPLNQTAITEQIKLSKIYQNGDEKQNITQDMDRSLRHLIKAVELGGEDLCGQIAEQFFQKPNGTDEGLKWLQRGAMRNESDAIRLLETKFPTVDEVPSHNQSYLSLVYSAKPVLTQDGEIKIGNETVPVYADKRPMQTAAIVKGHDLVFKDNPYLAYVNDRCTGFIVSDNQVLTAAHCLPANGTQITVCHGSDKISEMKSNTSHQYLVTKVQHLQGGVGSNREQDLALLTLDRHFPNSSYYLPLPNHRDWRGYVRDLTDNGGVVIGKNSIRNANVKVTGWGSTSLGGRIPDNAQATGMAAMSLAGCAYQTNTTNEKLPEFICTRTYKDGEYTAGCHGDSGAPMLWHNHKKNKEVVMGLLVAEYGGCVRNSGINLAKYSKEINGLLTPHSKLKPFTGTENSLGQYHQEYIPDSHSTKSELTFSFVNSGSITQSFSVQYDYKGVREHVPSGFMLQGTFKSITVPEGSRNIVFRGNAHDAFSKNGDGENIRFQLRTRYTVGKQGMTLQTWGDLKTSFSWQTTFD